MLLLFLYFAFLSICRSATFDDTGPQSIMEFINSDFDPELVQIANETLLVEVLVQNGTSELGCGSSGCDANNAKLPGLDRRQYVENDEDQKCGADHNFIQLGTPLSFNAWGSHCNADLVNRHIICRIWDPHWMVDAEDTYQSTIPCQSGYVCRQLGEQQTRFGDEKARTDCVLSGAIRTWAITARELGEKCSSKFRYPSAGAGGSVVRFHIWAWDLTSGLFVQLKWMYLKINGVYVKSATGISDWTFTYASVTYLDDIELCGTASLDNPALELQGQGKVL